METSEAQDYLNELIENQILVSELEPNLTGNIYFNQLLSKLEYLRSNYSLPQELLSLSEKLISVQQLLIQLDSSEEKINVPKYKQIHKILSEATITDKLEEKYLFQVDSNKKALECSLKNKIAGKIRQGIQILYNFNQVNNHKLSNFKNTFIKKYGFKEMPLLQVLDPESGIGYNQPGGDSQDKDPILGGIAFTDNSINNIEWDAIQKYLFDIYLKALQDKKYEIELDQNEISNFAKNVPSSQPDIITVSGSVIDDGNKVFIRVVGGGSPASLLGRFTHVNNNVDSLVKELTSHEQKINPDKVFAEIIHLPQSRTGNILFRTIIRPHEIPFLAKPSVNNESVVSLADLWIKISESRIILFSKKLGKEIVPRLSTAHSYSFNSLDIYHFLCDMQYQNIYQPFHFNWGNLSREYTFLPRVVFKDLILFRATWQLKKKDFIQILPPKKGNTTNRILVKEWRKKWKIPRYILFTESDNELLIDLESEVCLELFNKLIKNKTKIILKEFLFEPSDNLVVKDQKNNRYTNEFIMFFERNKANLGSNLTNLNNVVEPHENVDRKLELGSNWIYYKIYVGYNWADHILINILEPLAKKLIKNNMIDSWFFIRYSDPELHLRVRFKLKDVIFLGNVVRIIFDQLNELVKKDIIWKVQTDTYERELERYGKDLIEYAEKIFFHDSMSTIIFLRYLKTTPNKENLKWIYAIALIDRFLSDFGLNLIQKLRIIESAKNEFNSKTGINSNFSKVIGKKYRVHKSTIQDVIEGKNIFEDEILTHQLLQILNEKSKRIVPIARELNNFKKVGSFDNWLFSCIHMMVNRLFRSRQNEYELLIYNLLFKYYSSKYSRQKNTTLD